MRSQRSSSGRKELSVSPRSSPLFWYFYILQNFSLHHDAYEVSKDAYNSTGNKNKNQYPGDPFFQVGVFAKEMAGIEQEANQENNTQDNWKNSTNGIGYIGYWIFNPADLREKRERKKQGKEKRGIDRIFHHQKLKF